MKSPEGTVDESFVPGPLRVEEQDCPARDQSAWESESLLPSDDVADPLPCVELVTSLQTALGRSLAIVGLNHRESLEPALQRGGGGIDIRRTAASRRPEERRLQ